MPVKGTVSPDAFADRLAALGVGSKFALAVSGGRDSMALMRLSFDYAQRHGASISAYIVDHGLRAAAREEAARAQAWCSDVGVSARVLTWRGEKPKTGLQAAARNARYRLLIEAASADGITDLLTAHSADDQAETALMRLARGGGPDAFAAMSDEILIATGPNPPIRLLRPLLTFTRDQLTLSVKAFSQPYIDDPSNADETFERVRARRQLNCSDDSEFLKRSSLITTAKKMGAAKRALRAAEAAAFRRGNGVLYGWGGAALDRAGLEDCGEILGGLAARLIYSVGAGAFRPEPEAARDAFFQAASKSAATLGGVMVTADRDRLWIYREPAALLGRAGVAPMDLLDVEAGAAGLWDNRFIVRSFTKPIAINPLGEAGESHPAARLFSGPAAARASIPALYSDGRLIGAPGLLPLPGTAGVVRSLLKERFDGKVVRF